jgi:hypothetical protein
MMRMMKTLIQTTTTVMTLLIDNSFCIFFCQLREIELTNFDKKVVFIYLCRGRSPTRLLSHLNLLGVA